MPIYIIDTTSTFRMKYAIEAKSAEHALDELTMTEHNRTFDEITQKWLGEQILDVREVTSDQFDTLMESLTENKDEMSSYWMGDQLIHKVQYED
jgi:hypothetical protein